MYLFDGVLLDENGNPSFDENGKPIIDWDANPAIFAVRPLTYREHRTLKKVFNGLEPRQVVSIVEQFRTFMRLKMLDSLLVDFDEETKQAKTMLDVYLGNAEIPEDVEETSLKGERSKDPMHDLMVYNSVRVYENPVTNTIEDIGVTNPMQEIRLGMAPSDAISLLIVHILRLGGRVIGIDKNGVPEIEAVDLEDVEDSLPADFLNNVIIGMDEMLEDKPDDVTATIDIVQGILTAAGVILPPNPEDQKTDTGGADSGGKAEASDDSKEQDKKPKPRKRAQRPKTTE